MIKLLAGVLITVFCYNLRFLCGEMHQWCIFQSNKLYFSNRNIKFTKGC
jgi:hypothetical protein